MSVAGSDLSARQRRHVHMSSTIFSPEGPSNTSLYVSGRQQDLYEKIRPNLRENNQMPPEITMPSASDVRCTQNVGHGAVWAHSERQAEEQVMKTPRAMRTTGPDYVVYDGEVKPVVKCTTKDAAAIPKEFWATSVNLQWHDTRNEACRQRGAGSQAGQTAEQMKLHQMSSEVLGKERLLNTSKSVRGELVAETHDNLKVDSQQMGRGQPKDAASPNARERYQQNLVKSQHNTMPLTEPQSPTSAARSNENPANAGRRRAEKNFSDMFDCQMGERKEVRGNREEILGSRTCYFLDPRSEIATRNKDHWKNEESTTATDRKQAESSSELFDRSSPTHQPQAIDGAQAEARKIERACWESKDGMGITNEIARRRRQKDFQKDFEDAEGRTHQARRQEGMASDGVGGVFGGTPAAAWAGARSPRGGYPSGGASPQAAGMHAASKRTAKDTKLASLQSSIFS